MPKIRTTHVGSLVRPPELVEVLRAEEQGHLHQAGTHAAMLTSGPIAVGDEVTLPS